MLTNSNNTIATEIDAIIAQAMREYAMAKDISPFDPIAEEEHIDETIPDEIPENSSSILVEETTSRFSSAIWYDKIQEKQVTIAGLGGIGSYVAFLLARMHPSQLVLYDDDVVEAANMSGQLYTNNSIGVAKVLALAAELADFSSYYNVISLQSRFTLECEATDIMICGFDNMESRKIFFNKWKDHVASKPSNERSQCLFIDGRLAAENFQVFCIKGDDYFNKTKYEEKWLFSDAQADETVCSYKQTTFMANMIGSIIANLFVNFCANECDPLIPRDLPFYTEYTAETMYFKVVA